VPETQPLSGTRALLVEDDSAIRTTLADLLRDDGCAVTTAGHGREALSHLRQAGTPDVIILDLMMPVMDGWEFRLEQEADPTLAGIPVIAMSADVSAKARAIAAAAYVRKPIDFDTLVRQIRAVVDRARKQRLAAADRMAALGTLASGIAHEINNPLTFMLANLQVLHDRLPRLVGAEAPEIDELLSDTMEGAERIRRIVKQAQMVAPAQPEEREAVVELRSLLEGTLALVVNQVRHRARLVTELDSDVRVRGDRGRIEQLFLNLLLNAVQSMPEGRVNEHEIRVVLRALPSERALIEIADTGCGIPVNVQERVFQPFFTTKPVGQGTGLGLSICHGIVTALGGDITFQSEAGRGTVFRVVLPTTVEAAARVAALPGAGTRGPLRRVLVVDNEPSILRVVRQILEPAHNVTVAADVGAAVALISAGRPFDLVLCELMLPGTGGIDLYEELQRSKPEMADRVTFMTAGAFTPRARHFLETRRRPWLAKPFDREQLLDMVTAATTAGARGTVPPAPSANAASSR
jgi:signal transduction histidine kinase